MPTIGEALIAIITAVLTIVLGLAFSGTVLSFAATSGGDTNMGSFAGVQNLNDLTPLVYYLSVILVALVTAIGAVGMFRRVTG